MTRSDRPDMRYWPYEEGEGSERSVIKRVRNGVTDEGIRWAVMARGGYIAAVNGYAQIPFEGHPWTGIDDYEKCEEIYIHGGLTYGPKPEFDFGARAEELYEMTKDTDHPLPEPPQGLSAHPAVTFADVGGWIGFDTSHAWDEWSDEALAEAGIEHLVIPGMEWPIPSIVDRHSIHWTVDKVVAEAISLASQIALKGLMEHVKPESLGIVDDFLKKRGST